MRTHTHTHARRMQAQIRYRCQRDACMRLHTHTHTHRKMLTHCAVTYKEDALTSRGKGMLLLIWIRNTRLKFLGNPCHPQAAEGHILKSRGVWVPMGSVGGQGS